MIIIPNNYEKILKDMIFNQFSENLKNILYKNNDSNPVFNYVNLLSGLDNSLCNIAKKSLVSIFESIDNSYRLSSERKAKYHIKAHHNRTILTIFGEITFKRTFYTDKYNNGSFCYLDRFLGLKKNDYFDPYIKALVIDYSANHSIPNVAKIVNDSIGNRINFNNKFSFLSRQTIRNIILESKLSNTDFPQLNTPDNLFIIADEKWVHTQRNNSQNVMIKSIVVFDGINSSFRRSLSNKRVFAGFKNNQFLDDILDYLYYSYDLDRVKNIYIMGDGAKWIKNLSVFFKLNSNANVVFALDKFHFKQALHHICLNETLEDIFCSYVLNNNKKVFKSACDQLINSSPHRNETITSKKEYILNNWNNILNLYRFNLSCPMESQISHNIAYLLTSRPKGYSLKMLDKILKIRLLYKNNQNIKFLYLNNYNNDKILTINQEHLNFSIFESPKNYQKTIIYNLSLYNNFEHRIF